MIKLENLSFKYNQKNKILDNINLTFNKKEITMIIGKNGSGKSTICNLITNLIKGKGNIIIDDLNIKKYSNLELRKKIGIVFQNPNNQIIFNKVFDDLKFTLDNLNLDTNSIDKALKDIDMLDYKNRNPYELSLGEKQKIALANVLAINPEYFIFDEITSMIDYKNKKTIYNIIKNLKEQNKGIIMVTNSMEELLLADKIIILNNHQAEIINKEDLLNNIEKIINADLEIPLSIKILLKLKEKGINNIYSEEDIINFIGDNI